MYSQRAVYLDWGNNKDGLRDVASPRFFDWRIDSENKNIFDGHISYVGTKKMDTPDNIIKTLTGNFFFFSNHP